MSILGAFLHVLVFIAVLGFARSGLAGTSRSAHIGLFLALAGTALLFVGELASIPVRDQRVDDTGAAIVGAIFGIGGLLSAVGFIAAGLATARAGLWQSWRRFTPLATGISICGVLALQLVDALDAGIAVYGLCLLALAVAPLHTAGPSLGNSAAAAAPGTGHMSDTSAPSVATAEPHGVTAPIDIAPQRRPGWSRVRRFVRSGADWLHLAFALGNRPRRLPAGLPHRRLHLRRRPGSTRRAPNRRLRPARPRAVRPPHRADRLATPDRPAALVPGRDRRLRPGRPRKRPPMGRRAPPAARPRPAQPCRDARAPRATPSP